MGTDVYMSWNKQSKTEKKAQITGYAIDAGDRGYLRASIGMVEENTVLRLLFPGKFWKGGLAQQYDFEAGFEPMKAVVRQYLQGKISQELLEDTEQLDSQAEMHASIMKIFSGKDYQISTQETTSEGRKMWAKSLVNFFELGREKQAKGLKPKVYISW